MTSKKQILENKLRKLIREELSEPKNTQKMKLVANQLVMFGTRLKQEIDNGTIDQEFVSNLINDLESQITYLGNIK